MSIRPLLPVSALLSLALSMGAAAPAVAVLEWTVYADPTQIRAIAVGGETVWAGGLGGLVRLDPANGEAEAITTAEGLAAMDIADLLWLDGELWVAMVTEGLQRYRPGEAEPWFRFQTFPQGLASDALRCLVADPVDGLWYGSDAGYGLIRSGTHVDLWNEFNGLANSDVQSLAFSADTLLVGTAAGLYRMDPGENPLPVAGLPLRPVDSIVVLADSVWVLIDGGIRRGVPSGELSWLLLALPQTGLEVKAIAAAGGELAVSLGEPGVSGINDRVWRYAPGGGWTNLSAGLPNSYHSPGYGQLYWDTLVGLANGELWLAGGITGGLGPGLAHHDGSVWEHFPLDPFPLGSSMNSICLGPSGNFWGMSTVGGARWTDGEWTRYPSTPSFSGLPRFSLDVLEDSQGWVWFNRYGSSAAPVGALGRIEVATGTREPVSPTGNAILRMLEDDSGNRWFARDEAGGLRGGIDVCTPADEWLSFDTTSGLPANTIDDLALLSATRIAMRARGAGLFVWDHAGTLANTADDTWWSPGVGIEDASGLLDTDTQFGALAAAGDGGLWVGQQDGLVRVLPTMSGYRARAQLGQKTSFSDGLLGTEVQDLAAAPDGSVWVGTELGLTQVRFTIETDQGSELLRWTASNWTNEAGRAQLGSDLVGPESLAPLPAAWVDRVAVDPAGDVVWLGTGAGIVRLAILPDPAPGGELLAGAWLYPNPARLALGHEEVRLGGLTVAADIVVYNLEGQLVREVGRVEPGGVAWDLKTRFGSRAVSGVYLLRLEAEGETETRELVLVR